MSAKAVLVSLLELMDLPFRPQASRLLTAVVCFVLGVVGVLGFPPYSQVAFLVASLSMLMALSWRTSWQRAFQHGFYYGLGHFLTGFSWLITSLHDFGHIPLSLSFVMLFLLAGAMAVYPGLFAALLPWATPRPGWLLLTAPVLWTASEWLRANLLGGFAWNLAGYAWHRWDSILQLADLGGVYLLSWLILFLAVLVLLAVKREGWRWRAPWALGLGVAILVTCHAYGTWRLTTPPPLPPPLPDHAGEITPAVLKVGLVQGNIHQTLKWQPEYQETTMQTYISLTRSVAGKVDLVVWPETAIPMFLQASPHYTRQLAKLAEEIASPLLVGSPTATRDGERWQYHNSLLLLDSDQSLDRRYDKHHLVPFGEFIPFRQFLPMHIQKLTAGAEDFHPGPGPVPLPWSKGAIGGLICYEADVPGEVRELAMAGAKWLINATNDGWFGEDAKPQHLAMARLRTIENRLPMVRVANTGISAVFDPYGREVGRIEANRKAILVLEVPRGWGVSPYHRLGDLWILYATLLVLAMVPLGKLVTRPPTSATIPPSPAT